MAEGYQYVIEMVDKLSGPAKTAAEQVSSLADKMTANAKQVDKLKARLEALNQAESVDIATRNKLVAAIEKEEAALQRNAGQIRSMVKAENDAAKAAREQAAAAEQGATGLEALGASLGAVAAVAAVVVAALAAVGAALYAGAKLAIQANEFKRKTLAGLQAVTGTAEAASETFKIIRKASDEIGISEEKAQALGLSLLDAGVAQDGLADTLKAIALVEKTRGEQAAGKLQELIKKSAAAGSFKLEGESLVGTGLKTEQVLSALGKRLGKSNAEIQAMLKAGQITAKDGMAAITDALGSSGAKGITGVSDAFGKFYEKILRLFEDVDVSGFVEQIGKLAELFDTSTVSGAALKFLADSIFTGLFAAVKEVFPYLKVVLLEVIIIALKLYIAAKPLVAKVKELWASASEGETLTNVLRTVVQVVAAIAIVIAVVVAAVIGFQVALTAAVYTGIYYLMQLGTTITEAVGGAWEKIKSIFTVEGATSIATSLIDGLVGGITGGAGRVVEALTGVGKSAIGAVKGVLGIASPSKVMAEMGGHTVEGFAGGVEDGSGAAQGALEAAVAPPKAAAPVGSGGGGAASISVGSLQIMVGNAGTAAELAELIPAKLVDALEALAMQIGGPSPSTAGGGT